MRFWIREVAGWLLVLLGLYIFRQSYNLLTDPGHFLLEGSSLTIMGVIVFRGGIHLLKIAVAAQVCVQATETATRESAKTPLSPARGPVRSLAGDRRYS